MIDFGIVVHGGAGTRKESADGCRTVCEAAFGMLEKGSGSLDAVVEAARILEDDEQFNAGTGSVLRIDGKTIEMDAAVMDSEGQIGIIINVRKQKNPILIACAVIDSPHVALAGRGAEEFALSLGFEEFSYISEQSLKRYARMMKSIEAGKIAESNPLWQKVDWSLIGRFSSDTIGAVALDSRGIFAVATSTGGASPMLVGRVGDTPMPGCGFYAGFCGAVAATGIGEEIIKRMLSRRVYDLFSRGSDLEKACSEAIADIPAKFSAGVIAISKKGYAVSANTEMAYSAIISEDGSRIEKIA
jgi:L-asparaginase / beta-aspartyl-peptidase